MQSLPTTSYHAELYSECLLHAKLSKFEKVITKINKLKNSEIQLQFVLQISKDLGSEKTYADPTPTLTERSLIISNFSKAFIDSKKLDVALEIAKTIPDIMIRSLAISDVSEAYIELENFKTALQIAKSIPNEPERNLSIEDVKNAKKLNSLIN